MPRQRPGMIRCAICGDWIEEEGVDTIYGVNPKTFRNAHQCYWCHVEEYEQLAYEQPSKRNETKFRSKQEEYIEFVLDRA